MVRSAALLLVLASCGSEDIATRTQAPLLIDAYCEAMVDVQGQGPTLLDVEADYLPHVVNCENGAADQAALEAQAVAARSYLYYRLSTGGSIGDGTGDQVYSCGREPGPEHVAAVEATSGRVLQYQGTQVAAFYVAGALQDGPSCTGGTDDPTSTEQWVTYNEGLSGDAITQTELGFVSPSNHANRGCMSQNGGDCLAEQGYVVDDILRFYYGEDIEIVQAEGACVTPVADAPDAGPGGDPDPDDATGSCAAGGRASPFLLLMTMLLIRRRKR